MKKILLITDSLALPRELPEICLFEKTWPYLLKQLGYTVHQVSIGGATSSDLIKQAKYHVSFYPDILILQFGIVDCAPRFMTKSELIFTNYLGIFGKAVRILMNRMWVRKIRNVKFVSQERFYKNVISFKKMFNVDTICIGIAPASSDYENILPGVKANIVNYNKILENEFINFISLGEEMKSGIMSDFHHLNEIGHSYILSQLIVRLKMIQQRNIENNLNG